jgi:hypothetical protein
MSRQNKRANPLSRQIKPLFKAGVLLFETPFDPFPEAEVMKRLE